MPKRKIKVGLIVDEYFGGAGTAYGGYGFLARDYIAKYLPDDDIHLDVLLGIQEGKWQHPFAQKFEVDGTTLYRLPSKKWASRWLRQQDYDVYLSIEITSDVLKYERDRSKRLIHWVQDPRPWSEWQDINTVKMFRESCYWNSARYDLVHQWHENNQVRFISQGYFLNQFAKELYRLDHDVPIEYVPNPVNIDRDYRLDQATKKKQVIFLGRIESVKRGWLFGELATLLPQYEFIMLGQATRDKTKNETIMNRYSNVPNLHLVGHVEGEKKSTLIKEAKILVNTSIHEALPISFLEALAYGTLLVSCRDPECLTSRFGKYVGKVLGDGFESVGLFAKAVEEIMENDSWRTAKAKEAIEYIKQNHTVEQFQKTLRRMIHGEHEKRKQLKKSLQ